MGIRDALHVQNEAYAMMNAMSEIKRGLTNIKLSEQNALKGKETSPSQLRKDICF